ncbi:MAG: glycosyltransferase family 2 protein [Anaerolineae bacterium]|nr:glycosyltransferase family 2 protein [Anaerolineae bacterium]
MTTHLTQTKPPVLSVVLPVFSVVLPVFNERESLAELHRRLSSVMIALAEPYEIIYVDDGSRDGSGDLLAAIQQNDAQVRVLHLSRNFGHQAAISAGLDHAGGDAVIVLDADLQDPPEVLPALLAQWRLGFDVVYAVRRERKENLFKRSAYDIFYRLLRQVANVEIPLDAGDFCVLDRRVADVLRKMPERNRFMRGIRSWIGFRQIGVPYNRAARFAGQPKYSLLKLLRLAFDGFFSFSYLPLRLASLFGLLVSFLGFLLSVWTVYKRFTLPEFPSGFATIVVGVMFLGGIQLIALGVIGEYVGRIFDEVKQRPLYIIGERRGFDDERQAPDA